MGEKETLAGLKSTLELVLAVEESAGANRALRADWEPRRETVYTLIRDRASEKLGTHLLAHRSQPTPMLQQRSSFLTNDTVTGITNGDGVFGMPMSSLGSEKLARAFASPNHSRAAQWGTSNSVKSSNGVGNKQGTPGTLVTLDGSQVQSQFQAATNVSGSKFAGESGCASAFQG